MERGKLVLTASAGFRVAAERYRAGQTALCIEDDQTDRDSDGFDVCACCVGPTCSAVSDAVCRMTHSWSPFSIGHTNPCSRRTKSPVSMFLMLSLAQPNTKLSSKNYPLIRLLGTVLLFCRKSKAFLTAYFKTCFHPANKSSRLVPLYYPHLVLVVSNGSPLHASLADLYRYFSLASSN